MSVFTEPRLSVEFLASEAPGFISRDTIVVAAGAGIVVAGTVLGKRTTGGTAASAVKASGPNTGNGTLTLDPATPVLSSGKTGVYQVRFTGATAFTVTDPSGLQVGTGTAGTAFATQIKFTATAGGTAFVAGDGFDVSVVTISKYVPSPAISADGSDQAMAVNMLQVDATMVDAVVAAITNDAEVVGAMLTYDPSINSPTLQAVKASHLASRRIKVR